MLKTEGQPGWGKYRDGCNPADLVMIISDITHKHNVARNATIVIVKTDMDLYLSSTARTSQSMSTFDSRS